MRAIVILIFIAGCAAEKKSEDYKITATEITLTNENHSHGWQKQDCFFCHVPTNLHQVNRLGHSSFDSAKSLVDTYGIQSCRGCHGTNGIP